MNKEYLMSLREKFREDFRKNDYCIGEAHVEEMFRVLLGGPKPDLPPLRTIHSPIGLRIVEEEMERMIPKLKHVMESDSVLYRRMTKK